MGFPQSRETHVRPGAAPPAPPQESEADRSHCARGLYPSLRTPSKMPPAVGGRQERTGRTAFAAYRRSLRTPSWQPALGRLRW